MGAYNVDNPKVGVVSHSDFNRHLLSAVLSENGFSLSLSVTPEKLLTVIGSKQFFEYEAEVDAWLLDIRDEHAAVLDSLVEHSAAAILINDDVPITSDTDAQTLWKRRLLDKMEVAVVPVVPIVPVVPTNAQGEVSPDRVRDESAMLNVVSDHESNRATALGQSINASINLNARTPEQVWVLVGSLGGPEAVREFLNELPALPIAMIYGQHLENNFDEQLVSAVNGKHSYSIQVAAGNHQLLTQELVIVPVNKQVRFLPHGRIVETRQAWAGNYQPALDQVISDLARIYRENLGVIVFSGMCNDGEIGCRVAKSCGATVWAQSPDSCVCPSMPNAVINTDCVSYQGSPKQLALSLASRFESDADSYPHILATGL